MFIFYLLSTFESWWILIFCPYRLSTTVQEGVHGLVYKRPEVQFDTVQDYSSDTTAWQRFCLPARYPSVFSWWSDPVQLHRTEGHRQERLPEPKLTEPLRQGVVYRVLEATQERSRRPGQECLTSGKIVVKYVWKIWSLFDWNKSVQKSFCFIVLSLWRINSHLLLTA